MVSGGCACACPCLRVYVVEEGCTGVRRTTAGRPWCRGAGEGQRDAPLTWWDSESWTSLLWGKKCTWILFLLHSFFPFFGFHKRETICVVCNGERQIQEELQVFLEAEERGRDPVLNSALFLGSEAWLQWSSVRGLLCRAGLSLGTQAWCQSPGRNLASDGAHGHVLCVFPILCVSSDPWLQAPRILSYSYGPKLWRSYS